MCKFHKFTHVCLMCRMFWGQMLKAQPHLTLSYGFYLLKALLVNMGSNLGIVLVPSHGGSRGCASENWDNILIFLSLTRRLKIMVAFM